MLFHWWSSFWKRILLLYGTGLSGRDVTLGQLSGKPRPAPVLLVLKVSLPISFSTMARNDLRIGAGVTTFAGGCLSASAQQATKEKSCRDEAARLSRQLGGGWTDATRGLGGQAHLALVSPKKLRELILLFSSLLQGISIKGNWYCSCRTEVKFFHA